MKRIKYLLVGTLLGLLFGAWFGINYGRGKPVYSNPFAEKSVREKAQDTASDLFNETRKALRDSLDD